MGDRALSFGAVASAYERYRPGYPDALVDHVLAYADRPVRTALEIGAGTGKATRAFANRGIAVTATEPDPAMLDQLRVRATGNVTTVQAGLEDLHLAETFDLVFAAASLHWTTPESRWSRVAALLVPGGVFASFGGQLSLADPEVQSAVAAARTPFLADDGITSPDGTPPDAPMLWPGTELLVTEEFTDVRQWILERRPTLTAQDYVGYLSTVSAYLQLSESVRLLLFRRILEVLPPRVSVTSDIYVHLARMAS